MEIIGYLSLGLTVLALAVWVPRIARKVSDQDRRIDALEKRIRS